MLRPLHSCSRPHLVANLSIFSVKQQLSCPPLRTSGPSPPAGGLPSYFGREEKALTLAVRRRNSLQLEEVEEDLHLHKGQDADQTHVHCQVAPRPYLSHDLQRPAVVHGNGLRAVQDLAVLLRGPQQRGPKNRGQVVQRHLVDALVLGHPVRGAPQRTKVIL